MALPDSSDIDAALLALLQSDATLSTLVPDGVYMDQGPANMKRFAVVDVVIANDLAVFGKRAIESVTYRVQAVMLSTANGNIKAAAKRIDDLLENTPLTVTGYAWMSCFREERIRYLEVDEVDTSIRWHHRGGQYRVELSLS